MKKLVVLATTCVVLVVSLVGCSGSAVNEVSSAINAIGEVSLQSGEAIESAQTKYDALTDEEKAKVGNYDKLQSAEKEFTQQLYSATKKEIETADKLAGNYYTQYYDAKGFDAARESAEAVLNSSDEERYSEAYSNLKAENESLQSYIDGETAKSYSVTTDLDDEYPFMIDEGHLPSQWNFSPIVMQTSSHPTNVVSMKKATDLPTYIDLFINGSSRNYTYAISQLPTKEISVQDENGEIKTALVNTEVRFAAAFDQAANQDPSKELNERPGYFFVDKNGYIVLALPNYDGEDHYVLYVSRA